MRSDFVIAIKAILTQPAGSLSQRRSFASEALDFLYNNRVKMTHSEFDECINCYVDYLNTHER